MAGPSTSTQISTTPWGAYSGLNSRAVTIHNALAVFGESTSKVVTIGGMRFCRVYTRGEVAAKNISDGRVVEYETLPMCSESFAAGLFCSFTAVSSEGSELPAKPLPEVFKGENLAHLLPLEFFLGDGKSIPVPQEDGLRIMDLTSRNISVRVSFGEPVKRMMERVKEAVMSRVKLVPRMIDIIPSGLHPSEQGWRKRMKGWELVFLDAASISLPASPCATGTAAHSNNGEVTGKVLLANTTLRLPGDLIQDNNGNSLRILSPDGVLNEPLVIVKPAEAKPGSGVKHLGPDLPDRVIKGMKYCIGIPFRTLFEAASTSGFQDSSVELLIPVSAHSHPRVLGGQASKLWPGVAFGALKRAMSSDNKLRDPDAPFVLRLNVQLSFFSGGASPISEGHDVRSIFLQLLVDFQTRYPGYEDLLRSSLEALTRVDPGEQHQQQHGDPGAGPSGTSGGTAWKGKERASAYD